MAICVTPTEWYSAGNNHEITGFYVTGFKDATCLLADV